MTDIVERLGRDLMEISYDDIEAMVREAVEEIERLQAALQLAADDLHRIGYPEAAQRARRALENKPDQSNVAPDVAPAPEPKSKI